MNPQIVSSLAMAVVLLVAAIMLHSPMSVLCICVLCLLAWISHTPGLSASVANAITFIGLAGGAIIWLYLAYRAVYIF